ADIERNGNDGLGHPEPLKGNLATWYSRAIDEKNRLVYKIEGGSIHILQCRNHYDDK
ncbi:MAG: type II toxin-antitoxin system YoeB family toxin, partial [Treponema sp.]|nr:type II toxin-antitoxin system YoeB family toxin [Treponema sp.]